MMLGRLRRVVFATTLVALWFSWNDAYGQCPAPGSGPLTEPDGVCSGGSANGNPCNSDSYCPGGVCEEDECESVLLILLRFEDEDWDNCPGVSGWTEPGADIQWLNPLTGHTASTIENTGDLLNIVFGDTMCVNVESDGKPCQTDSDCGATAPPGSCADYGSFADYVREASYGRAVMYGDVAGYYILQDRSEEPGFDPGSPPDDHFDSYPVAVCGQDSTNEGAPCNQDSDCPIICGINCQIPPCCGTPYGTCRGCEPLSDKLCLTTSGFWLAAVRRALAGGYDADFYDRVILVYNRPNGIVWNMKAASPKCWYESVRRNLQLHETGHFWSSHGSALDCGASVWDTTPPCEHLEYGNPFDIMGAHGEQGPAAGHFNAVTKHARGWLVEDPVGPTVDQTIVSLDDTGDDGTYFLSPLEAAGDNSETDVATVLRMRRDDDRYYYFEFRRPMGWDDELFTNLRSKFPDSFPDDGWDGLLVNVAQIGNPKGELLDLTPDSQSGNSSQTRWDVYDGRLPVTFPQPTTFSDSTSCFTVTPIEILDEGHAQNPYPYPIIEVDAAANLDDGDPCTLDECIDGVPTHTPDPGVSCDDGNDCTESDVCDANGDCAGTNLPQGTNCDDGQFCTAIDQCDGTGTCSGHGRACPPGWFCDEVNDGCLPPI